MSLVTIADFNTHLYQQIIDQIDEDDESLLQDAIDAAEDEVSSFNVTTITAQFTALSLDDFTTRMVKDIAVWNFIGLSSYNISTEFWAAKYDSAQQYLRERERWEKEQGWKDRELDNDEMKADGAYWSGSGSSESGAAAYLNAEVNEADREAFRPHESSMKEVKLAQTKGERGEITVTSRAAQRDLTGL